MVTWFDFYQCITYILNADKIGTCSLTASAEVRVEHQKFKQMTELLPTALFFVLSS